MEPLAYRMKPKTLDKFYGQEHIIGDNKLLSRLISADKLSSVIFWGPPGCGKTSLARVIANTTKANFVALNATSSGVADIKKIVEETKSSLLNPTGKTIVFIDEIHRFNKLQQDALLPIVEKGQIILIGATTENPYFEVNRALVSRSTIFKLEPLSDFAVEKILNEAISNKEVGLGNYKINIEDTVLKCLSKQVSGDVRTALNALELAVITTKIDETGYVNITSDIIAECMQQKKMYYDKDSAVHHDTISAFIKSMRGSDPDATVHYLGRMIASGEDPMFIARRIVICAAEDVGLANPNALTVAVSAMNATHQIGMPESRIILSEAAIYVAKSRKSNSAYLAIDSALKDIEEIEVGEIPLYLRNAPISDMKKDGYSIGYKYPHNYENGYVDVQYLPDKIKDKKYYNRKSWEE